MSMRCVDFEKSFMTRIVWNGERDNNVEHKGSRCVSLGLIYS